MAHSQNILVFTLFVICMALVWGFSSQGGFAAKDDVSVIHQSGNAKPIYIPLGKAELVAVDGDVSDILVADPSVVDVVAVQSNRLYVSGLRVGDTNLIALDAEGNIVKKVDLHVKYDLTAIQALVGELFADEDVKVGSIHDQILLTGTVSNAAVASKITNIVGHYVGDLQDNDRPADELVSNLLEVRGEQQVMLQVKIVEAQRSVLKELGVEANANDPNTLAAQNLFDGSPPSSFGGDSSAVSIAGGNGLALSNPAAATFGFLRDSGLDSVGTLGLFINALEEQSLINILAEPNLTTVSGEQAGFLAGGETPVPSGLDQLGNVVVEFRQFGVSLNFKPTVLSSDRISLQMETEVSSINFENAIPTGAVQVPGFDVRRASTTVELPSGGSIMIAGILQSEVVKGLSGLPGIKDTPVLGDLLSSDSFQRDETELVVVVTPYLVEAYSDKKRAEHVPIQRSNPLANSFAANIRRSYGDGDYDMFAGSHAYGYLVD